MYSPVIGTDGEVLKISEFEEIAFKLETHHSIFYKLWEMGEMVFDEEIPTACVKFDKAGNYVSFHFNEFWESKTSYERLFIICHECLRLVEPRTSHKKRRTSSIG